MSERWSIRVDEHGCLRIYDVSLALGYWPGTDGDDVRDCLRDLVAAANRGEAREVSAS